MNYCVTRETFLNVPTIAGVVASAPTAAPVVSAADV